MKQHELEPFLLCGGWCIPHEKVSGGCCCVSQLLTAASIIKSSAVPNWHADGPIDAATAPDCVFEMQRFVATYATSTLTSQIYVWNRSLKIPEKDRLKNSSFLEKLQLTASFPFVSDDSDHEETMSCDSPPALWCRHIAALHHSGV